MYAWKFDSYVNAMSPYPSRPESTLDVWSLITCPVLLISGGDSNAPTWRKMNGARRFGMPRPGRSPTPGIWSTTISWSTCCRWFGNSLACDMEFAVLSLRPKIVPWCRFSKFERAWNPVCIA